MKRFLFRAALLMVLPLGFFGCQASETATNTAPPAMSTQVAPTPTFGPIPTATAPRKLSFFLPDDSGKLRRSAVPVSLPIRAAATARERGNNARVLADALMKKSPEDFPKGARVLDASPLQSKDTIALNFNKAFLQPAFWQGSARTNATVYALVNTVGQLDTLGNAPPKVQFFIEGKPVQVLGEFDAGEPLAPDAKMVRETETTREAKATRKENKVSQP